LKIGITVFLKILKIEKEIHMSREDNLLFW